jgi:2OG-Fe(II) oxygenase superfamily
MTSIIPKRSHLHQQWVSAVIWFSCCCLQTASFTFAFSAKNSLAPSPVPQRLSNVLKRAATASVEDAKEEPLLIHTFWGQERTEDEIIAHVTVQLAGLVDNVPTVTVLNSEPPLVVIDNFISPDHCMEIIQSAKDHLQRSTLGAEQEHSETRTSTTAWIRDHQCEAPLRRIASAVSRISGVPTTHMENLQVCRYQVGQEFAIHTDHLDTFNDLPVRGRLCTCLIYLQECTEGGATTFPEMKAAPDVVPVPGRAVFFWNTMERPGSVNYASDMFLNVDMKLQHAGMPVDAGEKWICNRWVHPIDIESGVRGV